MRDVAVRADDADDVHAGDYSMVSPIVQVFGMQLFRGVNRMMGGGDRQGEKTIDNHERTAFNSPRGE